VRATFTLGHFVGIPIRVHYSFVPVFAFITWLLVSRFFPAFVPGLSARDAWIAGLVGSLALSGSLLAHEFGHAVVVRRFGREVRYVSLFLLGGLIEVEAADSTPSEEFWIAIAGPVVSLLLGALDGIGWLLAGSERAVLWSLFLYLALSNLLLCLFNLIPGYPLDGGRVLRAALWHYLGDRDRAENWSTGLGLGMGAVSLVAGVYWIVVGHVIDGFWFAALGVFLLTAIFHATVRPLGTTSETIPPTN